ncbi:hydrogenase maturation protease [candidate division KSB1 bacterium]|nr:hydrogenase maturation protease [candidate division KSB1 bacterium]NIS24470.1 hydrogenase maturation protease [candidate division KSB1 bacterium]NIT70889.1 hydrogenase maturation protease [candidate division KSB1 bacterium]NIU26376.1 hydrogenase maturation protease [candidate division KSB1 bacterium]NIU90192.1 hydrogenase maturation protease [candidate division KSB1 bacterium]
MGDEGVGVHVVNHIRQMSLPEGIECVDGGTGGFHLLDTLQRAKQVILIDATLDGAPIGTVRRLRPRFSSDYPKTLTAHDIGLKDLLDGLYLLGEPSDITLFAISITHPQESGTDLSPQVAKIVPELAKIVLDEAKSLLPHATLDLQC